MNWLNWIKNNEENRETLIIGEDYLIETTEGQYIAGKIYRRADKSKYFCSSDGAWTIEIDKIQKWVVII